MKKLFKLFMILTMLFVFGLLVQGQRKEVSAGATPEHSHDGITFDKTIDGDITNGYLKNGIVNGNYYLTTDITISEKDLRIGYYDYTNICLNGHTITLDGVKISVLSGNLKIYDTNTTPHYWKESESGLWVPSDEVTDKVTYGGYITSSSTVPHAVYNECGEFESHGVDFVGINCSGTVLYSYSSSEGINKYLDNTTILGCVAGSLFSSFTSLDLENFRAEYNVCNTASSMDPGLALTIGDNVVVKNNIQDTTSKRVSGVALTSNTSNEVNHLNIKEGVVGTSLDVYVSVRSFSDITFVDDYVITQARNADLTSIFALATAVDYDYNSTPDKHFFIRSIQNEDGTYQTHITRWHTVTYQDFNNDIYRTVGASTLVDNTKYIDHPTMNPASIEGIKVQMKIDGEWTDINATVTGWVYKTNIGTRNETSHYVTEEDDITTDIDYVFEPSFTINVLQYNLTDGKFYSSLYGTNTMVLSHALDTMYEATVDDDGFYTNITFNNLVYDVDGLSSAIHFESASDCYTPITITLIGNSTISNSTKTGSAIDAGLEIIFKGTGTLTINGQYHSPYSNLAVSGGAKLYINSTLDEGCAIPFNCYDVCVKDTAEVYIYSFDNAVSAFNVLDFEATVVLGKTTSSGTYQPLPELDEDGWKYASKVTVDGVTTNYTYIKLVAFKVTEQPTIENDYEFKTNANPEYQWYLQKLSTIAVTASNYDDYVLDVDCGVVDENLNYTVGSESTIYISTSCGNYITIKSKTNIDVTSEEQQSYEPYGIFVTKTYDETTLEYTYKITLYFDEYGIAALVAPEGTVLYDLKITASELMISGATNSTYQPTEAGTYYAKATLGETVLTSDTIVAYGVNFDTQGANETVDNLAGFSGMEVVMPTTTLTKTGYTFLGWNTDQNATVALTFTEGKYTVGNSDVTFYAIWKVAKKNVSITTDAQEYSFDTENLGFKLLGTDKDLGSFVIKYKFAGNYQLECPTIPDTYEVLITRAADDNYNAYNVTTSIVITQGTLKVADLTYTAPSNLAYDGNAKVPTFTTTKTGLGSMTIYYLVNDEWVETAPKAVGTYQVKLNVSDSQYYKEANLTTDDWTFVVTGYTISFNSNGATGTMTAITNYGGKYTLPENGFTAPTGKVFVGWALSSTGDLISDETINIVKDTVLYAKWQYAYNEDITVSWKEGYVPKVGDTVGKVLSNVVISDTNNLMVVLSMVSDDLDAGSLSEETVLENKTYYIVLVLLLKDNANYRFKTGAVLEDYEVYAGNVTAFGTSYTNCPICNIDDYGDYYEPKINRHSANDGIYIANLTTYAFPTFTAKSDISLTTDAQEYTYGDSNIAYKLTGTHKDLESYEVSYYVNKAWTTTVPTNAGSYNVKITRAEDTSYFAYTKEITNGLVINKAKVEKPAEDTTNYVYTGSELTYQLATSSLYTITGTVKATNAGDYHIYVSLKDKTNYTWADGSIKDLYYLFSIDMKEPVITVDTTPITKVYGEAVVLPTATSDFGTVTCNTTAADLVNVGEYFVAYSVEGDDNHYGSCVEIVVRITKGNATITVDTTTITKTYGETLVLPEATSNFGTVTCDKTVEELTNAGTYTVTYTVEGTNNYNGDTKQLTVVINKAKVAQPTVTGTYTYTGNAQTVTLTGVEAYMTTTDELTKTNAGTYTITYSLDNNHEWNETSNGTVTWSISKANAAITVDTTTIKVLEGQTVTLPTATTTFGTVTCDKTATDLVAVGNYTVTYTVAGTDNYNGDTKTLEVVVKAKEIVTPAKEDTTTPEVKVETENGFDPEITVEVKVEVVAGVTEETASLTIDYATQLNKNETLNGVYDVKLLLNGIEIPVSDLGTNVTITVKMLIPTELIGKTFRIIHVHDASDITEITLGEEAGIGTYIIDEEGYLVTKIDRLSEFAFIEVHTGLTVGAIVGIVFASLLLLLVIAYVLGYFFCYRRGHLDEKAIKVIYVWLPRGNYNKEV